MCRGYSVTLQPFEKRAALIAYRLLFVAQPFIPLQHPFGRVAPVPRYCDGRYAATLQLVLYCLHQEFCRPTATVPFVNPQRVDECIRFAVQRSVFGAVRNERLYASMMLLVGDEYANGVFPVLILYHSRNVTQFCLVIRPSVSIPVLSNSCKTGKNWNGNTLADVNPQPPMAVSDRRPKCRQMRRER